MANYSLKSKNYQHHTRSISFPSKSHPSIRRIEDELNKLRVCNEVSSSSSALTTSAICSNLAGLNTLHDCLAELLRLPLTQQAVAKHRSAKCINHLLDGSLRLLDVSSVTMDAISQSREHVKDLQSALRRRKGDSSIENSISQYVASRRKVRRDCKTLVAALEQVGNEIRVAGQVSEELEDHLAEVVRVLKEVTIISISVFGSVLSLLLLPLPYTLKSSSGWSLLARLMHDRIHHEPSKGREGNKNELESVDFALSILCRCGSKEAELIQSALSRLETLEVHLEGIEDNLQCLFRCLIRSRTTLLNVVSC